MLGRPVDALTLLAEARLLARAHREAVPPYPARSPSLWVRVDVETLRNEDDEQTHACLHPLLDFDEEWGNTQRVDALAEL